MRLVLILLVIFIIGCSTTKKSIDEQYPEYLTIANNLGGNYFLEGGRYPLRRPTPAYICSAQGKVVVGIKVNRQGVVIEAVPGIKGSTTKSKCLLEQSKKAALKTIWKSSDSVPEVQIGKIIYNFSLY